MNRYFAYGSNMNEEQMKSRCPSARVLGVATLAGRKLVFTVYSELRKSGCADIVEDGSACVYGLLYEISDRDLAALDIIEGVPTYYARIRLKVELSGELFDAYAYEVVNKDMGLTPSSAYIALIEGAAERFGFPEAYRAYLAGIERSE